MNPIIVIFTIILFTFTVFAQKKAPLPKTKADKVTAEHCLSLVHKAQEVHRAEFGVYTSKMEELELDLDFTQSCQHQFKFDLSVKGENFTATVKKGKVKVASIDNKRNLVQF